MRRPSPAGVQAPPLPASEGPIGCGPGAGLRAGRRDQILSRAPRPRTPDPWPRSPCAPPVLAPDARVRTPSAPRPCAAWGSRCLRCVCKVSAGRGRVPWPSAPRRALGQSRVGRAEGSPHREGPGWQTETSKGNWGRSRLGRFPSAGPAGDSQGTVENRATPHPPRSLGVTAHSHPDPPAWQGREDRGAVT